MPCAPVAILIVSYNVRDALLRALASIPSGYEIVVVDNASVDGTVSAVRALYPGVDVVASPTNLGFAKAMNLAAQRTRAKLLLWLNPDAWVPPGAIESLLAHFRTLRPGLQHLVVGPRQVDEHGRLQLACGPVPTLAREGLRRLIQRRLDRPEQWRASWVRAALDAWAQQPARVGWVAGSALLLERDTYFAVGGIDPAYFLFFEDIDFCLRVRQAGGTILYDPTVTFGHSRGTSAAGSARIAACAYRDSQARFAKHHLGPWVGPLVAWTAARKRPDHRPVP